MPSATDEFRVIAAPAREGSLAITVKIAARSPEALQTKEARNFAEEQVRQHGFAPWGIRLGYPKIYPVSSDGELTAQVLAGQEPIKEWYAEFTFDERF